jgi:hypothetical protein
MTMTWLTWRQFRVQAAAAAATAAVLAILLAITGPHMAHLYDSSGVASCTSLSCQTATASFTNALPWFDVVLYLLGIGIMFLTPAVAGVFWGAPLITREIEDRTLPLTWNQSVTRTRWAAVKLGLIGLVSMATAGLFSLMLTWWSSPMDSVLEIPYSHRLSFERFGPVLFATRGIVPIGYAAFAFALGVTAGMLLHSTVSAMASTLGIFAAVQFAWPEWIRAHLIPPVHTIVPLDVADQIPPAGTDQLPAHQPLLGVPVGGDRDLRRGGRGARRLLHPVAHPPHRLTGRAGPAAHRRRDQFWPTRSWPNLR